MGTYIQWKASTRDSSFFVVWGKQKALVSEVVESLFEKYSKSTLGTFVLSGTADSQEVVSNTILANSLEEDRLVVIRHADNLEFSDLLVSRMKSKNSGVVVLQFDEEPSEGLVKQSKEVRCSELHQQDLVRWVREQSPMKEYSARVLIDWTDGNTEDIKSICFRLNIVGSDTPWDLSSSLLERISDETKSEFVDALIEDDKKRAIYSSQSLGLDEFPRIASVLDYRLSRMTEMLAILANSSGKLTNSEFNSIPFNVVKELRPLLGKYPKKRVARSRKALAVVDDALRSGVTVGLWEALIGLW